MNETCTYFSVAKQFLKERFLCVSAFPCPQRRKEGVLEIIGSKKHSGKLSPENNKMAIRQFIKYKSQTLAEAQWTHVIETLTGWLLICKKFQ